MTFLSKNFQKTLTKQGMKFKLGTKVVSAKKNGKGKVDVVVEPAKGGKQETVSISSSRFTQIPRKAKTCPAVGS